MSYCARCVNCPHDELDGLPVGISCDERRDRDRWAERHRQLYGHHVVEYKPREARPTAHKAMGRSGMEGAMPGRMAGRRPTLEQYDEE